MSNRREQLIGLRQAVIVEAVEAGQLHELMNAIFENMGQKDIVVPDGLPDDFSWLIAGFLATQPLLSENDGRLVSAG